MKTSPILFGTPMVQANLAKRKTQTRRIIKPQPNFDSAWKGLGKIEKFGLKSINEIPQIDVSGNLLGVFDKIEDSTMKATGICHPYVSVKIHKGDILWVRETFISGVEMYDGYYVFDENDNHKYKTWYKADGDLDNWYNGDSDFPTDKIPWKPSIHMPKAAARIFLKVTNVRVERLQDISNEDCIAEGIESFNHGTGGSPHGILYKDYKYGTFNAQPIRSYYTLWESINGPGSWDLNPWVWVYEYEHIDQPEKFIS